MKKVDKSKLLNVLEVLEAIKDSLDKPANERVGNWVDRNVHGLAETHQLTVARLEEYSAHAKECGAFLQAFVSESADSDELLARAKRLLETQAKRGL